MRSNGRKALDNGILALFFKRNTCRGRSRAIPAPITELFVTTVIVRSSCHKDLHLRCHRVPISTQLGYEKYAKGIRSEEVEEVYRK